MINPFKQIELLTPYIYKGKRVIVCNVTFMSVVYFWYPELRNVHYILEITPKILFYLNAKKINY